MYCSPVILLVARTRHALYFYAQIIHVLINCLEVQVYMPSGEKAMQEGMIEVKERHAFVVFFKTDESGFVPVGQVSP